MLVKWNTTNIDGFEPFQRIIYKNTISWNSYYSGDRNPSELFTGVKIRAGIYLARIGYERKYVSKYIKEKSGKNFGDLLTHAKMKKARSLLRNGTMTVENIAYESGYQNVEHFNRQFRKLYDMTPLEYRNSKNK